MIITLEAMDTYGGIINMFKAKKHPSYKIDANGNITVTKKTPATNWSLYYDEVFKASKGGTGYTVNVYRYGLGIKSIKI